MHDGHCHVVAADADKSTCADYDIGHVLVGRNDQVFNATDTGTCFVVNVFAKESLLDTLA
jgi:hypothetical protein